jgi:type I restriction enzyme S subunit
MKLRKDKWRTAPLGEICKLEYGNNLTDKMRTGGSVPVYGSAGIVGWHNKPLTNSPTLIVGRKGSVGNVFYSEIPCFPIDTTYYVEETVCKERWESRLSSVVVCDAGSEERQRAKAPNPG